LLQKIIAVVAGSLLIGVGINAFLVPYHLLDGGIIGISLIIKYVWEYPPGLMIILLSIPLYLYAWFYFRLYFYNSLHGLLTSSFFIDFLHPLRYWEHPPIFLSSLIGGFLVGTGIGMMLQVETSTGGTDLLAQFISKATQLNVGVVIFVIDGIVILVGGYIIGANSLFYSAIAITAVGITTSFLTMNNPQTK
jgi:uncharacterized membrane-anchored protein YitT (DUF2179 family)